ncbi:MAG: methylmalonyl Co-A mutase-associated GTPase MeaB, partial [Actinobacteria bacterium]|nr:methylmalonyl Co-A mutase-associated GTPase MeaB [Actinomycetota bacterium]
GYPWVLVETVGVGQSEVDVAMVADTTVVIVAPGWGDGVQAEKAGILEVADVLVVNKADRPGADGVRAVLGRMLDLVPASPGGWRPPVVATSATTGDGVDDLLAAIGDHRAWMAGEGRAAARRRAALAAELRWMVDARAGSAGVASCHGPDFEALVDDMAAGGVDPGAAAVTVLGRASWKSQTLFPPE